VWRADLDGHAPLSLLSAHERERAARIVRKEPAARWAASRAIVKALLSRYESQNAEPVHFSVSHSGPVGVVALSPHAVGVDVEYARRLGRRLSVGERAFGPTIAAALDQLDVADRETQFLRHWTRREAMIKLSADGAAWWSDLDVGDDATATVASAIVPQRVRVLRWS